MNADPGTSGRPAQAAQTPPDLATRSLVRAWWAVAVAAAVTLAAALRGPEPGDPAVWLVGQLVVIVVLGIGAGAVGVRLSATAMRHGRTWAVVPLFIAAFLVLQATLRVAGTLGRFYGWG
jgi:hypothetical protein